MSRFFHVQTWDVAPLWTSKGHLHFFKQLTLHFDRSSGMGYSFMELMRDDRDGSMIPEEFRT